MKIIFEVFVLNVILIIINSNYVESSIIYVKSDATGLNNGTSWSNAYILLQSALDNAIIDDQIWVAAGTYYPTKKVGGTDERNRAFKMKNNVSIYGGFAGNETMLSNRYWQKNETILSGDIGINGDITDNAYHVFYHNGSNLNSTALLDGFKIID